MNLLNYIISIKEWFVFIDMIKNCTMNEYAKQELCLFKLHILQQIFVLGDTHRNQMANE